MKHDPTGRVLLMMANKGKDQHNLSATEDANASKVVIENEGAASDTSAAATVFRPIETEEEYQPAFGEEEEEEVPWMSYLSEEEDPKNDLTKQIRDAVALASPASKVKAKGRLAKAPTKSADPKKGIKRAQANQSQDGGPKTGLAGLFGKAPSFKISKYI